MSLKLAVIGLGNRGSSILEYILLKMADVKIVAICDEYEDRNNKMADLIEAKSGNRSYTTADYMAILNRDVWRQSILPLH